MQGIFLFTNGLNEIALLMATHQHYHLFRPIRQPNFAKLLILIGGRPQLPTSTQFLKRQVDGHRGQARLRFTRLALAHGPPFRLGQPLLRPPRRPDEFADVRVLVIGQNAMGEIGRLDQIQPVAAIPDDESAVVAARDREAGFESHSGHGATSARNRRVSRGAPLDTLPNRLPGLLHRCFKVLER